MLVNPSLGFRRDTGQVTLRTLGQVTCPLNLSFASSLQWKDFHRHIKRSRLPSPCGPRTPGVGKPTSPRMPCQPSRPGAGAHKWEKWRKEIHVISETSQFREILASLFSLLPDHFLPFLSFHCLINAKPIYAWEQRDFQLNKFHR